MTQPTLFDAPQRPPRAFVRGATLQARACGERAATAIQGGRARLQGRYLAALDAAPHGLTDHEAASVLGVPLSSICSTRGALRGQLVTDGARIGPYGHENTVYRRTTVRNESV